MKNAVATTSTNAWLYHLVEQLVRSSQHSIDRSQSCVVNDIPEDLCVSTDPEVLSTVINGMLSIAIIHAKDSCIRISASISSEMVLLNLRDYNRFNSYSGASGLQDIQSLAERLGGSLAVAAMRQGEKTIALSLPLQFHAA
ncbi:MAG: HAMP domain-containing histidine kinase [Chitinophagaceae bacterium]|nr:MAG: HAMP domain-containing histidine kinase [Chitinophagaceae bacterium]